MYCFSLCCTSQHMRTSQHIFKDDITQPNVRLTLSIESLLTVVLIENPRVVTAIYLQIFCNSQWDSHTTTS